MNEKIKKLAVHVGAEFNIGFAGSPTFVSFAEDDLQKFAELIVKECAQISEEYAYSETLPMLISYHIKQHFGVE